VHGQGDHRRREHNKPETPLPEERALLPHFALVAGRAAGAALGPGCGDCALVVGAAAAGVTG
jgi:hypothetical protein